MKCFEKIKLKIVLLIVLIIAVVGIGTTYAYLTSSTNNLENTLKQKSKKIQKFKVVI